LRDYSPAPVGEGKGEGEERKNPTKSKGKKDPLEGFVTKKAGKTRRLPKTNTLNPKNSLERVLDASTRA